MRDSEGQAIFRRRGKSIHDKQSHIVIKASHLIQSIAALEKRIAEGCLWDSAQACNNGGSKASELGLPKWEAA